ncbi:MAG: cyclic nucleotide-binding domain-containing protein [Pseudomonadota bacterium]
MTEKQVKEGEIIFSEGDVADVSYLVISGSIDITYRSNDSQVKFGTIESGGIFGELAVFDSTQLRNNTAIAASDSSLKIVTSEEFEKMFEQCPSEIKPFLSFAFSKVIPAKSRQKTNVNSVTSSDVTTIIISPAEKLEGKISQKTVPISGLPIRIGGYPEEGERNRKDQLQLPIPSQNNPLVISRQHCEIGIEEDKIVLRDVGSRFGTIVNDMQIGRGRGVYYANLQKGENIVTLGLAETGYKLLVMLD